MVILLLVESCHPIDWILDLRIYIYIYIYGF